MHRSIVKMAVSDDEMHVQPIIECVICGRIEWPWIPVQHLTTLARAAAAVAAKLGIMGGRQTEVVDMVGTEQDVEALLDRNRRKAGQN